jgi:hypothetical protein
MTAAPMKRVCFHREFPADTALFPRSLFIWASKRLTWRFPRFPTWVACHVRAWRFAAAGAVSARRRP